LFSAKLSASACALKNLSCEALESPALASAFGSRCRGEKDDLWDDQGRKLKRLTSLTGRGDTCTFTEACVSLS